MKLFADRSLVFENAPPPRGDLNVDMAPAPTLLDDPINILIVDDEPKNLTVLETLLDDPGYRLVRAGSANRTLLALTEEEFALIIMDINMPDMSGFELAKIIKERRKTANVPIIFLTAYYNDDQHVLEGYGMGAVDYLHKPVNSSILRSKVAIFASMYRNARQLNIANRALLAEVNERRQAQLQLRELNETLELRVVERTAELTERARVATLAGEQLRVSEEFNRSLMEGTTDSVKVLDLEGKVVHLNGPGRAHLEFDDTDKLLGQYWWTLWSQESREIVCSSVDKARNGNATSFTAPRQTKNGVLKWWNVSVSPVHDPVSGAVARLIAVSRDVTDARQTEHELRQADEEKDRFIATLAHELRNPLAPIRNAVNVMRRREADPMQLAWCRDVIDRQVGQMTHLLEDLLDVSRITQMKLRLRLEQLDLLVVLERAIEIASPFIEAAGHSFSVQFPSERVVVNGDLTRLAQVVSNLLINASKYTDDHGKISLIARVDAGQAVVAVKDSGIGIALENLPHIFDICGQLPPPRARTQDGLGIGLPLAKGLVDLHGGRLVASSEGPGKGSEFVVYIPATVEQPTAGIVHASCQANGAASSDWRILVVDDLQDSADSLALLLRAMGYEVRIAYSGEEAVRVAREFRPDVAFVDLGMPNVNGYETCRLIRAEEWGKKIMLVAQTGWGQDDDRRRTHEAGFDIHLIKPLDAEGIDGVLRSMVARGK